MRKNPLVTNGKWCVSYQGYNPSILHVYYSVNKKNPKTGWNITIVKGDHYGKQFFNMEQAEQFAFEHGYLKRYFKKAM